MKQALGGVFCGSFFPPPLSFPRYCLTSIISLHVNKRLCPFNNTTILRRSKYNKACFIPSIRDTIENVNFHALKLFFWWDRMYITRLCQFNSSCLKSNVSRASLDPELEISLSRSGFLFFFYHGKVARKEIRDNCSK